MDNLIKMVSWLPQGKLEGKGLMMANVPGPCIIHSYIHVLLDYNLLMPEFAVSRNSSVGRALD